MWQFQLNLFSMSGKIKILHMSWMAFLISFIVWFNHAPLILMIKQDVGLNEQEVKIILLLNVVLTIPARVLTGLAVDRFGARRSYSVLLAACSMPCFMFALANSFEQLAWARFLLGFIGAGFVIGIRVIGDWFPSRQMGMAVGIYAGWGNFGSALAAMLLPGLALYFGGEQGWRYAIALTGLLALVFSLVYYLCIEDSPEHESGIQHESSPIMEVSSVRDLFLYLLAIVPLYLTMSLLTWRLSQPELPLLSEFWVVFINLIIWGLFLLHAYKMVDLNADRLSQPVAEVHRYRYRQVVILGLAYLITFGSKLAVVSMLPIFFYTMFSDSHHISHVDAGIIASSFVFLNLIARPAGGWLSDLMGRKRSLYVFSSGLTISYFIMAQMSPAWPVSLAIGVTLLCSIFMQAAEGAIFAMVPLVKRSMTGQVAGIVGAYGNAGAILFLTLLTFISGTAFFQVLAICSLFFIAAVVCLEEPRSFITQIMPDGTLAVIELD